MSMPQASLHTMGALRELHLAEVLRNDDPERRGRVEVRLHASGLQTWAAVVVPSAGGSYGVSLLPRTGEIVVLGFVAPDLPLVLGALWTGAAQPPDDARPVQDRYLIRTPAGLQLLLDDAEPKVDIQLPSGSHVTVTDSGGGKATVEVGGEKLEMSPGSIKCTTSGTFEVQASQVKISAGMVTVDAGMSKFSGVVKCDTLITQSVISSSYTPGAGNIW